MLTAHIAWDVVQSSELPARLQKQAANVEHLLASGSPRRVVAAAMRELRLGLSELRRRGEQLSLDV